MENSAFMEDVGGAMETPTKVSSCGQFQVRRRRTSIEPIEGISTAIQQVRSLINQVSQADANVLILGESGTGKELVARSIHRQSNRSDKPFVPVNCGAIPTELLESELFGHEKGAFTGAITTRAGRFELAEGGTLFLDEIGDMTPYMQVKLLRVLQECCYERIGSNKTRYTDVRIIAATHHDLEAAMETAKFREDLFYRLDEFSIRMPPLRERVEDIPILVRTLIKRLENERGTLQIGNTIIEALQYYTWPGNVRELSNAIERLRVLHRNARAELSSLPEKILQARLTPMAVSSSAGGEPSGKSGMGIQLPDSGLDLKEYLSAIELYLIREALDRANGVVAQAAKLLGLGRTTLVEKLRKYSTQDRNLWPKHASGEY